MLCINVEARKKGLIKKPTFWMIWRVRQSGDRFGVSHYWAQYGKSPNLALVPPDFPEEQIPALADALRSSVERVARNPFCPSDCIFLAYKFYRKPKEQKETPPCCI